MTPEQAIEDIRGTLAKYGFNVDRHNVGLVVTVALEERAEYLARLTEIQNKADLTQAR